VNEVCDILLHWIAARDWKAAFYAVVPPRKFEKGKKAEKLRKRKERRSTNMGCEAPEGGMAAESSSDTDEGLDASEHNLAGLLIRPDLSSRPICVTVIKSK
jgi:hypothetical protein